MPGEALVFWSVLSDVRRKFADGTLDQITLAEAQDELIAMIRYSDWPAFRLRCDRALADLDRMRKAA